jgi:hypothetical protein
MQILDYLGPIFPTAVVLLWEVEVCSYPSLGYLIIRHSIPLEFDDDIFCVILSNLYV